MSTPYKPYSSDSETDSESGSGSESDTSFTSDSSSSSYAEEVAANVPRNFRALADGLSMKRVGAAEPMDFSSAGSPLTTGFPTFKNYDIPKDPSGNEIKASSQNITSIIMLDSGDRDRNVFTQPTNVTLRLPRVYSNITNFQLIQIKLLSAFFRILS